MEASIFTAIRHTKEAPWKRTRGTTVSVHRSSRNDISSWFFYSPGLKKIFLKIGWNMFGRHRRNDFEIHSHSLMPYDFCIFVSTFDNKPPLIYALYDLIVDGHAITGRDDAYEAKPLTKISLLRGNKMMVFFLRHEM